MERLVGLKIEVTDCSSRYLSKHVDSYANLFYNMPLGPVYLLYVKLRPVVKSFS